MSPKIFEGVPAVVMAGKQDIILKYSLYKEDDLGPMKVAVTANGKDLKAHVDPRFGRAAYFIILDPDTKEYQVVENAQSMELPQGAGIQAGKKIVENKVDVLLTGNCGPKAFKVLNAAGIKVVINAEGTVEEAVEKFKKGELGDYARSPNVAGHWM